MSKKSAIEPTREKDFPLWYQEVIRAADLAEHASVRGCMVMKPWGCGIWELAKRALDDRIQEYGVEPVYFPLFIPLSYFEKEAKHISGFAKECAVVTHHRLEESEGKLLPAGPLEEPLVVRPTSEMIIGESFSRWIASYRDLPFKINQWANIVRWEMRPRIFLRTTEFLWQEGHTVHATAQEAEEYAQEMLQMYIKFFKEVLALPCLPGKKSPGETFPGALHTYTLELMMQDRKALQGCTSHNLGQTFAKAQEITFNAQEGGVEYAHTTSWGCTTRILGALIMMLGDDDGIRLPPKVAPHQVVLLPFLNQEERRAEVLENCQKIASELKQIGVRVHLDTRDRRGGDKTWEWIKKGVPLRLEIGPKDLDKGVVTLFRRDLGVKERQEVPLDQVVQNIPALLEEIHATYFTEASRFLEEGIHHGASSLKEIEAFFSDATKELGFLSIKWCGDPETEELLKPLGVTIRCLPLESSGTAGTCALTGKPATLDAILARAY